MRILLCLFVSLLLASSGWAAGPLGPANPLTREVKGIYTSIGGWFEESVHDYRGEYVLAKRYLYTELGWGIPRQIRLYGRVGLTRFTIRDAFVPNTQALPQDFDDSGFFVALGGAYNAALTERLSAAFFIKGTYHWQDYENQTAVGGPSSNVKITEVWDAAVGAALAYSNPRAGRMYLGPSFNYSSFRVLPSPGRNDLNLAAQAATWTNKDRWGIFAGWDFPLPRGFRLNLEARYSGRFAAGGGLAYVY